ncbi:MAG: ATP-binding cassette domain-containing protein [Mesorhizobium sp.]|nr:MAG: ATP-binding cassette domain-containing protein [Mesorhizobium sp.]
MGRGRGGGSRRQRRRRRRSPRHPTRSHQDNGGPAGRTTVPVNQPARVSGIVSDASIKVRAGEIVRLAGLVGCGRSELCRAVFGLERVTSGEIELLGAVSSASAA